MQVNEDYDLLDTFRRQHQLCARLLECSRLQMTLIVDENYTDLLDVISRKQRLIEQWDELKKRHPDLVQIWRDRRPHLATTERNACEKLIEGIQSLYETLLDEERESTEELTRRRDTAKGQLQNISNGAQTHQAYRDHLAPTTHRHLDIGQ